MFDCAPKKLSYRRALTIKTYHTFSAVSTSAAWTEQCPFIRRVVWFVCFCDRVWVCQQGRLRCFGFCKQQMLVMNYVDVNDPREEEHYQFCLFLEWDWTTGMIWFWRMRFVLRTINLGCQVAAPSLQMQKSWLSIPWPDMEMFTIRSWEIQHKCDLYFKLHKRYLYMNSAFTHMLEYTRQ